MSRPGRGASQREGPTDLNHTLEAYSRGLELRVWAMADSLRHGDNPSSIPGRGIEVSGVREYQHGDEARGIDWRVTARRGRLFVKEFSQERELPLLILLNLTPTLWSGRGAAKAVRALEAASVIAALGLRSGDRVGVVLAGGGQGVTIPPGNSRNQLPRILQGLMTPPSWTAPVPLAETLTQARFLLTERARVFLIGDFRLPFPELEGLRTGLTSLRDRHHLIPVRIKDLKEGILPDGGSLLLRDPASGGRRLFVRPRQARNLKRLLDQQEEKITTFLRTLGLEDWSIDVDDSLVDTLRTYLYRPRGRVARRQIQPGERKATGA